MFSWATSTFEKLSEAVAPPPTDGASRFNYCCQRGDEQGAIAAAQEIPGVGCTVNASKGQVPLHVACLSAMPNLIRTLLTMPGASLEVYDAAGNSPLHCACMSDKPTALQVVKMLIQEFGCPVAVMNSQRKTPYDVAPLNSVRQFLLPIQLQQETQQALDNGGRGLPPGIDLGGLTVSQDHLAPPPMGGPVNMQSGPPPSLYVAPPLAGGGSPYPPTPGAYGAPPPGQAAPMMRQPPVITDRKSVV